MLDLQLKVVKLENEQQQQKDLIAKDMQEHREKLNWCKDNILNLHR